MADTAGIEIRADLTALRKELQDAVNEFRQVNAEALKTASGVKPLEDSANSVAKGFNAASLASQAFSTALGFLGANSIVGLVTRFTQFISSTANAGKALEAVENRAKAVFGTAFPQVQKQAELLGQQFRRSGSDILQMQTDFALLMNSLGLSDKATVNYSENLAKLSVALQKARPDLSDADIYDKLQRAITGASKGLVDLGIAMRADQLQRYADSKQLGVHVDKLNDEAKAVIRINYLLEETQKQQQAATSATGGLADETETLSAAWQDLHEELSKSVDPILASAFDQLTQMIQGATQAIGALGAAWMWVKGIFGVDKASTWQPFGAAAKPDGWTGSTGPLEGAAARAAREQAASDAELRKNLQDAIKNGGGNSSGTDEKKKAQDELNKAENDYINALGDEAKATKQNLDTRKKELEVRRDLGIATNDELRELDRINSRVDYQADAVDNATEAWKKQKDVVSNLKDDIAKINQDIQDSYDTLQKQLKQVDAETAKQKAQTVADLLQQKKDLDDKVANGEGLTPDEQAKYQKIQDTLNSASGGSADLASQKASLEAEKKQIEAYLAANPQLKENISGTDPTSLSAEPQFRRLREINDQLSKIGDPNSDLSAYQAGVDLFNTEQSENPLQAIDREAKDKKSELVKQQTDDLADSTNKLTQKTQELSQAEKDLQDKQDAVTAAIDKYRTTADTDFAAIETRTKAHVDAQAKQFLRLKQIYEGVYGPGSAAQAAAQAATEVGDAAGGHATGGPIVGPGGIDNVPAWLTAGEHVLTVSDVAAMGGQAGVMAFRRMLHSERPRLSMQRFQHGGAVSNVDRHDQTINVTQHLHGASARHAPSARAIRWLLRKHS